MCVWGGGGRAGQLSYPQHPKYLQNEVLGFQNPVVLRSFEPKSTGTWGLWASGCPGLWRAGSSQTASKQAEPTLECTHRRTYPNTNTPNIPQYVQDCLLQGNKLPPHKEGGRLSSDEGHLKKTTLNSKLNKSFKQTASTWVFGPLGAVASSCAPQLFEEPP